MLDFAQRYQLSEFEVCAPWSSSQTSGDSAQKNRPRVRTQKRTQQRQQILQILEWRWGLRAQPGCDAGDGGSPTLTFKVQ